MRNKKLIVLLIVVLVLIVAIIVCGATFLVRHVDAYSYYENSELETYNRNVISAAGIEKNSSMFFVDEAAIKRKIENEFPNIGVVNIKRSFPDRVTINYVIYEKSFQYKNGDKYYQCYSSGRIGSSSDAQMPGYFTVLLSGATATKVGDYFQASNGKDRQYVDKIIKFLRSKGMGDFQINEFIKFIDLRRDGYVYIRTNTGCSIEIHDNGVEFTKLLDRGFAVYKKSDPLVTDVSHSSGLIKVYPNLSASATDPISSRYIKPGVEVGEGQLYSDDGYYERYYNNN